MKKDGQEQWIKICFLFLLHFYLFKYKIWLPQFVLYATLHSVLQECGGHCGQMDVAHLVICRLLFVSKEEQMAVSLYATFLTMEYWNHLALTQMEGQYAYGAAILAGLKLMEFVGLAMLHCVKQGSFLWEIVDVVQICCCLRFVQSAHLLCREACCKTVNLVNVHMLAWRAYTMQIPILF